VSATEEAAPTHGTLLDLLVERISAEVAAGQVEPVTAFAKAFTHRLARAELVGLSADELFGMVLGAYRLADGRGSEEAAVRAFTPTVARDGYQLLGSVLETSTDDSPFLFDSVNEELDARGLVFRRVIHPVIGVERGADGHITRVLHVRDAGRRG
jgi:glutamate dehydrogenase